MLSLDDAVTCQALHLKLGSVAANDEGQLVIVCVTLMASVNLAHAFGIVMYRNLLASCIVLLATVAVRGPYGVDSAAGGAEKASRIIEVSHVEINQAIQDDDNSVVLASGKTTVVRVYVRSDTAVRVAGMVSLEINGVVLAPIPSSDTAVVLWNSRGEWRSERSDILSSINFLLAGELVTPGTIRVREIHIVDLDSPTTTCSNCTRTDSVLVQPSTALRIVLLPIGYHVNGTYILPRAEYIDDIKAWIASALPVSNLEFISHLPITNDSLPKKMFDEIAFPNRPAGHDACDTVNFQISRARLKDIANSSQPRQDSLSKAHYYGIVSNEGGFYRGCSGVPRDGPDFTTIASGPSGNSQDYWKPENVIPAERTPFGGAYAAHELGHALGRPHLPSAIGCQAGWPNDDDWASKAQSAAIGSIGGPVGPDSTWSGIRLLKRGSTLQMQPLKADTYHDLMGYCEHPWISGYLYMRLSRWLFLEQGSTPPPQLLASTSTVSGKASGSAAMTISQPISSGPCFAVMGQANLSRGTAKFVDISVLQPCSVSVNRSRDSTIQIRARDGTYRIKSLDAATVQFVSTDRPDADSVAIFNAVVADTAGVYTLELLVRGALVDSVFTGGKAPVSIGSVKGVASGPPGSVGNASPITVVWQFDDSETRQPRNALTYTVMLSLDNKITWQTIAVGVVESRLMIERAQLGDFHGIAYLRVFASDGVREQSKTNSIQIP